MCIQPCPTLCDHVDWSLLGSPVQESFQARILECVAISFSRKSSWPRNWTLNSYIFSIASRFLTNCATWEAHKLLRLCSKSFKLGLSGTWTEKFQMYKLGFEEVEEPDIKLQPFIGSWRKQVSSRKASISASLTMIKPLCGPQQTVKNSKGDQSTRPPYLSPEKPVCRQEITVRRGHATTNWFQIGKGVRHSCILSPCLADLHAELLFYSRSNVSDLQP